MNELPSAIISLVAVVNADDEVLLLKRKKDVHCPDMWSYPGGKVLENEEPLQAAVRELKEETGIKGKLWRHVAKHQHSYDDRTLFFYLFFCRFDGEIKPEQCEGEISWCKLDKLEQYDMPEANAALNRSLLACYKEGLFPPL